jgi:Ca2+-binding RTX toxin-like protein
MRFRLRYFVLLLVVLITLSSMTAIAATNTIPSTQVEDSSITFQIAHLRPSACAGLSLTNLVTGSGALTGTESNDLILGSTGADVIDGLGGNDCILGGGGDDTINGGNDTDICIGGDGNDIFSECEGELQ